MRRHTEVGIAGYSERQIETQALDVQQHRDTADQAIVIGCSDRAHRVADVRDGNEATVHRGRETSDDDCLLGHAALAMLFSMIARRS